MILPHAAETCDHGAAMPVDSMPDSAPPGETKLQSFGLPSATLVGNPEVRWKDAAGSHRVSFSDRSLVGSAPAAAMVIADPTVSRIHAEFELREDGVWVRDLGSRNGTFVEGVMISGARVPAGSRIRVGSTELILTHGSAEDPPELWPEDHFGPLVGQSVIMRRLFAHLSRVARSESPVLIQGETGTGKELAADAIHGMSSRASKPLIVVDCAALPENLIESELFGHAKGAFTGAVSARVGAIEASDGGTVFLDEMGELPLPLQPRLLRVLESKTIRRVGETTSRPVDVRFICATHRDIRKMVNAGAFREDLYFRLAVLPVTIPPLRDRLEDIPTLVNSFLPEGVVPSPELMTQLARQPWLGNVRELRNFVHRAMALGTQEALSLSFARPSGRPPPPPPPPAPEPPRNEPTMTALAPFDATFKTFREQWIEAGECEYLRRLLTKHNRNIAAVARDAGLDRTYIYRLLRKHML